MSERPVCCQATNDPINNSVWQGQSPASSDSCRLERARSRCQGR